MPGGAGVGREKSAGKIEKSDTSNSTTYPKAYNFPHLTYPDVYIIGER
jgi:hypothetical protein